MGNQLIHHLHAFRLLSIYAYQCIQNMLWNVRVLNRDYKSWSWVWTHHWVQFSYCRFRFSWLYYDRICLKLYSCSFIWILLSCSITATIFPPLLKALVVLSLSDLLRLLWSCLLFLLWFLVSYVLYEWTKFSLILLSDDRFPKTTIPL